MKKTECLKFKKNFNEASSSIERKTAAHNVILYIAKTQEFTYGNYTIPNKIQGEKQ